MEKQYIDYNSDIIKLIDSVVNSGNLAIKLEKMEDGERIFCNYKSPSYNFHLDFPKAMFNFEGQELNFYDYGEFANIMKNFKYPRIAHNSSGLVLDMEKSSVEYTVGDSEAIKRGFNKEKFDSSDVTFIMTEESVKSLNRAKGLFGSEYLSFVYNGDMLKARLTSKTRGDNKYEEYYSVEKAGDVSVEFKTFALAISALSVGGWVVDVNNDGIVRFNYENNNDINLRLYCMRVDDE